MDHQADRVTKQRGRKAAIEQLLTVPAVAALWSVDRASVYRAIKSGALRAVTVPPGQRLRVPVSAAAAAAAPLSGLRLAVEQSDGCIVSSGVAPMGSTAGKVGAMAGKVGESARVRPASAADLRHRVASGVVPRVPSV